MEHNEEILSEKLKNRKDSDVKSIFQSLENRLTVGNDNQKILLNLESFFISNSFKRNLEDFLQKNAEKNISVALCGVGKGVRKVILQSIEYPLYIADDEDDAFDWLQN